jgi:hypothetical protein
LGTAFALIKAVAFLNHLWSKGGTKMKIDLDSTREKSLLSLVRNLFPLIVLAVILSPKPGNTQVEKEASDKFTYFIENGARMIRENEFEKVLDLVGELPSEKKGDHRVKALESSAYLKGYVVTKNKVYGKKWKVSYTSLIHSSDKSATPILVELLRDDNLYVRAFTAKALGFVGDKRALEELKRVAEKDESSRVRSRAKWAYEQISGGKLPKESPKE